MFLKKKLNYYTAYTLFLYYIYIIFMYLHISQNIIQLQYVLWIVDNNYRITYTTYITYMQYLKKTTRY